MRVAGVFVLLFVLFYVVCRLRLGRPIVLTLGLCGLRWGELEGLQAGDVDLKRQRIHVRRSATEVCHEIVVDVTKTGGGAHRHLPALAAAMSRRRLRWPSQSGLLFPDRRSGSYLRKTHGPAARRAGFTGRRSAAWEMRSRSR